MMTLMTKCYNELIKLKTFEERLRYLECINRIGESTFNGSRWLNQRLYHSSKWHEVKNNIIIRDNGCDLGLEGYDIAGTIYVHHIVSITKQDVLKQSSKLYDPNNLICVSYDTHKAIHYGGDCLALHELIERSPNDQCPWKR